MVQAVQKAQTVPGLIGAKACNLSILNPGWKARPLAHRAPFDGQRAPRSRPAGLARP